MKSGELFQVIVESTPSITNPLHQVLVSTTGGKQWHALPLAFSNPEDAEETRAFLEQKLRPEFERELAAARG